MATAINASETIRIDAILADEAEVVGGKLQLAGGAWNRIHVPDPSQARLKMALAIVLRIPAARVGTQAQLQIRLVDPDGAPVAFGPDTGDGPMTVLEAAISTDLPEQAAPLSEELMPIAVTLDGLGLMKPGRYSFRFRMDGIEAKILSFAVLPLDRPT
jgi:hypothetical protein